MRETAEKPYRSISEVSRTMGVKAHVLRYWETQFSMLRPRKNRGGVRMYRPKDIELLREIRHLLYDRGFTIAGARRKLLAERKAGETPEASQAQQEFALEERAQPILQEIEAELRALHGLLSAPPGTGPGSPGAAAHRGAGRRPSGPPGNARGRRGAGADGST